jgi:HSP20 family protein
MLPTKRSIFPTLSRFFEDDWNTLFDWTSRNFSNTATTLPSVNVKETDHEFTVEMAAPGMKKDDFQIELKDNVLTIKSEVQEEKVEEDEDYTRKEFSYQSFQRCFNLNQEVVDEGKINATYQEGILHISIPKKEAAKPKPARVIKIS